MNELLQKIEKLEKIDLNKELKTLKLDELQTLLLSTYIVDKNIARIRESCEPKLSISNVSDSTKEYIKDIKKGNNKSGIKDKKLLCFIDIAIIQAIKNIKFNFSFIELVNESYLIALQFIKKYLPKLEKKYSFDKIKEIFEVYCEIFQLQLQIKKENEQYSTKIAILVYLKVRDRLEKNEDLDSILSGMGLKKEYFENLDKMYNSIEIEDLDNIYTYTQQVTDEFENDRQTFMFTYFEEEFLIKYLNLEGLNYKKDEICSSLKIDEKEYENRLINILKKISETEEM